MGTKTIYFCDKCAKEVLTYNELLKFNINLEGYQLRINSTNYSLCEDCAKKVGVSFFPKEEPSISQDNQKDIKERLFEIMRELVAG